MYSAKTFNWGAFYGQLRHTIADITGFDGEHVLMDYSTKKVSYPYVTVSQANEVSPLAASNYSKEQRVTTYLININCYSTNGNDVIQISDDISTLLFDPIYRSDFHDVGAVIKDSAINNAASNAFKDMFNVVTNTIALKVDIYKDYTSRINKITSFNNINQ